MQVCREARASKKVIHRFVAVSWSRRSVVSMSTPTDIKVPRHSGHSKVEKKLGVTPHDGAWHRLVEMGPSSAEQTARAYNVEGASWELGYTVEANPQADIVSVLWARWVG